MIGFIICLILVFITSVVVAIFDSLAKQGEIGTSNKHSSQKNSTTVDKHKPTSKKHNGKCDGNCANCPPHYGYRYGRWYYGHDHVEVCVRR